MCEKCDEFVTQLGAFENFLDGKFTPENQTDSVFTQDVKDTLDELLLEVDDEANILSDEMQRTVNNLDIVQDYLLEAMSCLILTKNDIAELRREVISAYRDKRYDFLETVYALSALNEYLHPQSFVVASVEDDSADEDFNEWGNE